MTLLSKSDFTSAKNSVVLIYPALQMYYYSWITNWWLLLNFDVLGALVVLMTTLLTLSDYVTAGTAGLGITSAMSFMNIG